MSFKSFDGLEELLFCTQLLLTCDGVNFFYSGVREGFKMMKIKSVFFFKLLLYCLRVLSEIFLHNSLEQ